MRSPTRCVLALGCPGGVAATGLGGAARAKARSAFFCGIDTTNGEKCQGKGKGKGKGPVPQQPQGGQRLPARERSRSVPPWAKGASRSEEGKFDADQLD